MTIRFNWGLGVTLVYGAFAAGTLSMVALASSGRVDLVSDDYYAKSLTVDRRLAATRLGEESVAGIRLETSAGAPAHLVIDLRAPPPADTQGTLTWYRPSAASADRTISLTVKSLTSPISLSGLSSGHWRVQLQWTGGGHDYYLERGVNIP
ncbi:MAG: FixH family protein [Acidobacteriota bacterium]